VRGVRRARKGEESVIRFLFDIGKVDIDSKDNDGQIPLLWAVQSRYEIIVKLLFEIGNVDIDSNDTECC